ncbi:MAG: ATP-dependent sacrificial sulfur transferase LarE [Phycisphaeraceae bacterium]
MFMKTQNDTLTKLARLQAVVGRYDRVLTAYSGGIDSTLVAAVARQVLGRDNAPAVIGDSPSLPRSEFSEAKQLADGLGLNLIIIAPNEQNDPGYQANAGDRCYYCKTHLYDQLQAYAVKHQYATIFNGTNADDLGGHRPGLDAADEAKVVAPLVEAGLDKADVRELAQHLNLPNWDKPAAACLASRIPYGTEVTLERLSQVEQAEAALRELGFIGLRVRHHEQVARIELPADQMQQILDPNVRLKVANAIKAAGFLYVALDLEGFRSGSGNVALTISGTKA